MNALKTWRDRPGPFPRMKSTLALSLLALALGGFPINLSAAPPTGIKPVAKDGRPLNLDFEDGTLRDWIATGDAFDQQPIMGDTVAKRRHDMKSGHQGQYWIGTYEVKGDAPQGTLTSIRFKVTQPFAAFLVAGGSGPNTRVELVDADSKKVFFKTSGYDQEELRPVVVDLAAEQGREIFIRLVDEDTRGWGHINFDDFKFYAAKPEFANVLDPAANQMPPVDVIKFAGLSPEDAAKEMTLPPGFKATLFAGEPDVVQLVMAADRLRR